jgi:hypothetical protein
MNELTTILYILTAPAFLFIAYCGVLDLAGYLDNSRAKPVHARAHAATKAALR